jgi:hypothetical protein
MVDLSGGDLSIQWILRCGELRAQAPGEFYCLGVIQNGLLGLALEGTAVQRQHGRLRDIIQGNLGLGVGFHFDLLSVQFEYSTLGKINHEPHEFIQGVGDPSLPSASLRAGCSG